jgi:hypothetical protein
MSKEICVTSISGGIHKTSFGQFWDKGYLFAKVKMTLDVNLVKLRHRCLKNECKVAKKFSEYTPEHYPKMHP